MIRQFPFKRPDGGISVITPSKKSRRSDDSEKEWYNRVIGKARRDEERVHGPCEALPECDVLPSHEFRDAWESDENGQIVINPTKAQIISEQRAKEAATPTTQILEEQVITLRKDIEELKLRVVV